MRRQPWRLMDGVFPYAASRFRVIASTCWYFAPDRDQQAACEGARTGLASLDKGLTAQRQLPTHTFSPSVEAWPDRGADRLFAPFIRGKGRHCSGPSCQSGRWWRVATGQDAALVVFK